MTTAPATSNFDIWHRFPLAALWISAILLVLVHPLRAQETNGLLSPARLRCEYAVNPLGVDVKDPRLFWIVESKERRQRQSAYQILVASSAALLANDTADLWDSGKVVSDATAHIHYRGNELKSSQQVFWKVRVWSAPLIPGKTGEGEARPSAWSPTATWTMGLLRAADWRAKWICAPGATETLLMRKEFEVRPGLTRAVAHVCGLGQYEMTVNGVKADDDLLSPGWTDYSKTALYDTREVTGLLQKGTNTIGLVLGNGMYNVVRRNRYVKFTGSFGPLRAICQLELEYSDGSTQIVSSDDTWRTHSGPITFSNIYGGEDCDARLNLIGWEKPRFDDSSWPPAVAVARPPGELRGQTAAADPLRAIEVRQPVATRAIESSGDILYDFGQNASYLPRLRVTGTAGSTVRLTPSEVINADGSISQTTMGAGSRGGSWWEYTKGTDAEEIWTPKFCYIGCRYMQAHLTPSAPGGPMPKIESVEGLIVHSSAPATGTFECSNELLNRIHALVRWAQRANMVSVLTDCPHREKLGWLEQYHLNGPSIRYEFGLARLFRKGMNDMAEAQLDSGLVPNIAPEYTQFKGAFRAATEWGSAFIIVPWQQYQFDADLDLLRAHYDAMKRYFAYLESRATNGIVSEGLGDWYDLGPKKPGAAQLTPPEATATAFYYYDAWILSRVAGLLERPDDARVFSARAGEIRSAYNRRFFQRDKGSYAAGSQCANALPLVLGIVEAPDRPRVLAAIVRDVELHGNSVTAGDVGFRFLLEGLAQGNRSDLIYTLVNQDDKPGYGYQLKMGATSLCESWDANLTSSHNHFMLGQIVEWFYKHLAGIGTDPAEPGFAKITIRPQPVGDLAWAGASYDSLHGTIVSRWKRDSGRFVLNIRIPANTTATVFVPAKSADDVIEGNRPAKQSEGVRFLQQEKGHAVFAVESGEYQFESRQDRVSQPATP